MVANTDQKARLFDLFTGVGELVRDGKRDPEQVADVLQVIKEKKNFSEILLAKAASKPRLLLEMVGTTTIAATTKKFVAREKFVVNTAEGAPVKISGVESNFEAWFLDKVEEHFAEIVLRYGKLRRWSRDIQIISELGGEEKAETTLAAVYALMELQKDGKKGALLTNGYANIFYVRDVNGILCAVGVRWRGGGWHVGAYSVGDPDEWFDGSRVFARNS